MPGAATKKKKDRKSKDKRSALMYHNKQSSDRK